MEQYLIQEIGKLKKPYQKINCDIVNKLENDFHRYLYIIVLDSTNWNRCKAAKSFGITRNTLAKRIKNLGITKKENI